MTQNKKPTHTHKKTKQTRLKDFKAFRPVFTVYENSLSQYRQLIRSLKANKTKYEQKKLVASKGTEKGSGLMKKGKIRVVFLENGKKKTEILNNSAEEVAFWNRQRNGEVSVIEAKRVA